MNISPHNFKIKMLNLFCSFFPMSKEIILESNPDLACNTYELYRYMINNGVNEKFKITWQVKEPDLYKNNAPYNVYFIKKDPMTLRDKWESYKRNNRAQVLVACNKYCEKKFTSKKQLNLYIMHGSPVKKVKFIYEPLNCDYVITQSNFFNEHVIKTFMMKPEQVIDTGFPRNDQMFSQYDSMKKIYPDYQSFEKVIAWVPTFRQHSDHKRIDCDFDFPLGIPIIYSADDMIELNDFLVNKNVLIIYKPHPAQNLDLIKDIGCSNVRFLYSSDLSEYGIQTNEFLAQTDAMIGDYSGIYYDYLLLDKPIGITLDDYSAFKEQSGMVYGLDSNILVGEYIYNFEELKTFIISVVEGKDEKYNERKKIKALTNKYTQIGATEDLFNFIMKEYKRRFY